MKNNIKEIVKKFGYILVKKIPRKDYEIIYTDKDIFYLKKIDRTISEILFIHNAKEYLFYRGFKNIDRYIISNGKPYVKQDEDYYVMTKFISGRKCNITNSNEVRKASKALARFHNSSKGFFSMVDNKSMSNIGKQQKVYLEKCQDFIYMKSLVKMRSIKSRIDDLFLKNVDLLYYTGIESVKMLQDSGYFKACEREAIERYLCHNNFNHNNIIIDRHGECSIVNFDDCRFELRCFEIANFVLDVMNRLDWDFERALDILNAYSSLRNIEEREYKIMTSFLQFPQDIWEITTKYYYEDYDLFKDKYYKKLEDRIEKLPYKLEFLSKYKKEFG